MTALLLVPLAAQAKAPKAALRIEVLSNRADLISAGDALVAISYSKRVKPAGIRVKLGRSDVTSAFAVRENGRFEGLLATDRWLTKVEAEGEQVDVPGVGKVCELDQQGAIPWQTYQDAKGDVVYGGRPLGTAPRSAAIVSKKRARAAR